MPTVRLCHLILIKTIGEEKYEVQSLFYYCFDFFLDAPFLILWWRGGEYCQSNGSAKSGFTVTSENLVDVECGSSVSFDINIKDGYAFLSTSAGTYDQLTGVLTIENVTRDTMVDFNVENLGYNTNISYFYKFYGSDADKSSIYEGSSVDNSLYRVAQI